MTDKIRTLHNVDDIVDWVNDNFDHFDARCDCLDETTTRTFHLVDLKFKADRNSIKVAFLCVGALGVALYLQHKKMKKLQERMDSIEREQTDLAISIDTISLGKETDIE